MSAPRGRRRQPDPTWVTLQPALTTSSGRIWLVVGGALTAIVVGVFAVLVARGSSLGVLGIVIAVVLYAAMWAVRLLASGRARLYALAVLLIAIALAAMVLIVAIGATSATGA
jgi:hypothetical protein